MKPPPRPRGRPPLYCQEVHDKLVEAAQLGLFRRLQAMHAGIAESTLESWLLDAREHPDASPYGELLSHLEEAEAARAIDAMRLVASGEKPFQGTGREWTSAAWYLERKYPGEYGRRVQEIHGKDGAPLEFRVAWTNGKSESEGK